MVLTALLRWIAPATVVVWIIIVVLQVLRRRFYTWPERFYLVFAGAVAAYGAGDALLYNAASEEMAIAGSLLSLDGAAVAAIAFALYGLGPYIRPRYAQASSTVATVLLVAMGSVAVAGVVPSPEWGVPYLTRYRLEWSTPWAAAVAVLAVIGLGGILTTYLGIRRHSRRLAHRIVGLLLVVGAAVAASLIFYLGLGYNGESAPALTASMLVVPGLLILFVVSPTGRARLQEVLLRRGDRSADRVAAYLMYADGTLVGSFAKPGEALGDADLFAATLEVIQNFMRLSFPVLGSKWLQSVRQGEYTLVMERGRYTSLTVVQRGPEEKELRRRMRADLRTFEETHATPLAANEAAKVAASAVEDLLWSVLGMG